MGRPTKLNGAVLERVVEEIRRGGYDWVAAEAGGIGQRTFYEWLQRGRRGEGKYALFEAEVRRARAQARLGAEQWVREHNPLAWLRFGPGRERRGRPGWAEPSKGGDEPPEEELDGADPAAMEEFARMVREAGWDLEGGSTDEGRRTTDVGPCGRPCCAGAGEGGRATARVSGEGATAGRATVTAVPVRGGAGGAAFGTGAGGAGDYPRVPALGRQGRTERPARGALAGRLPAYGWAHGQGGVEAGRHLDAALARARLEVDWWPLARVPRLQM